MNAIKFCENNFSHGSGEIVKKIYENFPDITVTIEGCLGFCGDCTSGPFALVNDELIQAETGEELYDRITTIFKIL